MTKKRKLVWDNCKHIGEVLKSPRSKIKVEIVARDGIIYANMREWYLRQRDKEWRPGMKGFAIPVMIPIDEVKHYPADELARLIAEVIKESQDFAIEDPENAVWTEK